MPISGPASYLPTTNQFLEHWEQVNLVMPPDPDLTVAGGITRADLEGRRDLLESARDFLTDLSVDRAVARGTVNARVALLHGRLVEFNERVRADLPGSPYAQALPAVFAIGDAAETVRDALRQMSHLWLRINALSPVPPGLTLPLVLRGSYPLADFEAQRIELRGFYRALSDIDVDLRIARGRRNAVQDEIYAILKNYRLKVPPSLPAESALLATLPALTPEPGSTPDAPAATGVFNTTTNMADLNGTPSATPTVVEHEWRASPGDAYDTDDETVLESIPLGSPLAFSTDFSLTAPGMSCGFRLVAVTADGNEKGSGAVMLARAV